MSRSGLARRLLLALATVGVVSTASAGCQGAANTGEVPTPVVPALHRRLPADVRAAGTLLVATDASYAPASFFAPDGRTVVGFEPDLARALGRVLGLRIRFVLTDFVSALDDLAAHRVDVVMSAMTDTARRERRADFVNYFSAGSTILVQRGNPHGVSDIGDLCGHVVAVERGTVQVQLLARGQEQCADRPILVRRRATNADALVELRTGRATAVLNDYPPAVYLTSQPSTRDDYQLASDAQYEPGLYGIAVAKDERRLRATLRLALTRLLETGDYQRVLGRWDVADGAVRTVTVNAG